ncbi:MAG: LamG-like jellyroll fold domain-containing protein [Verrucomicrobiales bacterium]
MSRNSTLTLLILGATFSASFADESNLVHNRHTHSYNKAHPTIPTHEDRFTTSRQGKLPALPNEEPMFSFAVFGDRTGGPASGVNILADAVRDVNLIEPDLVMTVGDLIQGYNEGPEWLRDMREYRGIMDELLCPWFPVAGNHDVYFRGKNKPEGEHEGLYEKHFGPLWYAFEHKNSWFIVLYSDEGNPETGEKTFHKPESQKMSPAQFNWLKSTLKRAKNADHVFLFLHHPRWIGRGYGNDWDRVHQELVEAGNVSAVFAGHIHYMRHDPRDGINYVTLATTGGHQSGAMPAAGYLHHYNLVTVRRNQLGITAYPVGAALDVRDITPELQQDLLKLSSIRTEIDTPLVLNQDGSVDSKVHITLSNPATKPVEMSLHPTTKDPYWTLYPDHAHLHLKPGESRTMEFVVQRHPAPTDSQFSPLALTVACEYATASSRYPVTTQPTVLPFVLKQSPSAPSALKQVLNLDGDDDYLTVNSSALPLEDTLTLECWMNARSFTGRTGLVTKTEGSDYGIFVSDGRPTFSIFIGDSYLSAIADAPLLKTDTWHHVAGVYDGTEARLYIDGKLIDQKARKGERKTNDLPLVIGGDVNRDGEAVSHFSGLIDSVHLSSIARYDLNSFTPVRHPIGDDKTELLLHMDTRIGDLFYDASRNHGHATVHGEPTMTPTQH